MKTTQHIVKQIAAGAAGTALLAASLLLAGCSQSTSSSPNSSYATVRTTTELSAGTVTPNSIAAKNTGTILKNGITADSITVTRARIVFSNLKMHLISDNDTTAVDSIGGNGTIKVGPFVAEFDSSGEQIVSDISIPPGTYNRIKFEIHKLNDNSDASLLNDSIFSDFVNGGRYTIIIDGWSYTGGKAYAFTYKSSLTANLTVFIDSGAVFDSSQTYDLRLVFDPKIVFGQPGAPPLDPRDTNNAKAIDQMIKQSIKALRIPR